MKGKKQFTERKGFKVAVGAINVCLIIGMVFYLFVVYVERNVVGNNINSGTTGSVEGKEYTEEDIANVMDAADDQLVNVYYTLIQGSYAEIGDNASMQFGIDGKFSGFFDADHPDVSGYTYEVLAPLEADNAGCEANVNIYNSDKSSYVQYKLLFDENSNMQLYYPDSKTYILLSF